MKRDHSHIYIVSLPPRYIATKFEDDLTTGSGSTRNQVVIMSWGRTDRRSVSWTN